MRGGRQEHPKRLRHGHRAGAIAGAGGATTLGRELVRDAPRGVGKTVKILAAKGPNRDTPGFKQRLRRESTSSA